MDGWETRRRRGPEGGYDWCIIRLGIPGAIRVVTVDTTHFRGNYPAACSLDAAQLSGEPRVSARALRTLDLAFVELLPRSPLAGHTENEFVVASDAAFTHVRLKIYPDGGVARLRLWGEARPDWRKIAAARPAVDLVAVEHGGVPLATSDEFFSEPLNLIMPGPSRDMGDGWETRRRRGPGHDWVVLRLGKRGGAAAARDAGWTRCSPRARSRATPSCWRPRSGSGGSSGVPTGSRRSPHSPASAAGWELGWTGRGASKRERRTRPRRRSPRWRRGTSRTRSGSGTCS